MERTHSLLGPSSSNIWLNCTPAARFGAKFAKKQSDYADEGTLCHDIATDLISYRLKRLSKKDYLARLDDHKAHRLYNIEMDHYAEGFANYVLEIYYGYQLKDRVDIWIEKRIDYSHIAPEGFGHLDVAILSPDTIDIIDFKYGKGVSVSAIVNPQLGLYAVGVIQSTLFFDEYEKLNLHIYQPRIDNISVFKTTVEECLRWANGTVKKKAALAYKGEGEFKPGPHCKFCAAQPKCEAAATHYKGLAKYDFVLPYELSNDDIAEILLLGEQLVSWYTSVKDYAISEARKGVKFTGHKLVSGKSNRRYIEGKDEDIIKVLRKQGFLMEVITKKQLRGIGEMERLLGKARFERLLAKFVEKPEGAPTLVPVSDKRTAITGKDGALIDFKDIQID